MINNLTARALNIPVIDWNHPPDFWVFQAFNERFDAEDIAFAFPTQTVHVVPPKSG